ncbi:hypothetical protein BMB171_C4413 [Bacillus thuringiensis BMB171]|nr:hypothetical protein BMB171_C4413 [Bacillus thuringiensis BMB171]
MNLSCSAIRWFNGKYHSSSVSVRTAVASAVATKAIKWYI